MPRSRWMSSKRVMPSQTSRRMSGDQGSPATSRVRAMEHAISPNRVRCTMQSYGGEFLDGTIPAVISSLKEPNALQEARPMNLPAIVSPAEWQTAREALLVNEKQATRTLDALAAERRRLPMVRIDKPYVFEGPDGQAALVDLFD